MSDNKFEWTEELAIQFCEYAGLRIGKGVDIRQHVSLLAQDFKKSKEKDIPKDWAIQCFRYVTATKTDNIHLAHKDTRGMFFTGGDFGTEEEMLKSAWSIHSVKRLSDLEIFTVGDKFNSKGHNNVIIDGIILMDNDVISIHSAEIKYRYWVLSDIEKVKPKVPLFHTVKNEPVYCNQEYVYVGKDFIKHSDYTSETFKLYSEGIDRFLTESDADDFIVMNKPITINYKEVHSFLDKEYFSGKYTPLESFFRSKIIP